MKMKFTAILQKTTKWYIGYCQEVPGANGQGKTRQECLDDLAAAVELMLEVNRERVMSQLSSKDIEEATLTIG